jgi:hypothetical protein
MIRRRWRIPLLLGGAIVVGAVVYLAGGVAWMIGAPKTEDYRHRQPFDSRAWKLDESANREWPTRLRMADDIVDRRILVDKTKTEVLELLGPATPTDKWRSWDLVYWLGPERGFIRIDSEWLVVRFGQDGRVRDVRIVRD